ncbi:MAG: 2-C-methyl-D-erythritol 2,4-cyclodiphosphate synthase [Actinomycetota bacterium]|nr:2-C-methyl-D-erythritol 2,4-cyclodiphosphate synthase [Actinomycetota bacterium]
MRTGTGFDAHAFAEDRPLMLGCIEVPFDRGLGGHSDGDVVAHAICDAVLGATGLGDIGDLFPAGPRWVNAPGSLLLRDVATRVAPAEVAWVDATVICERPRLSELRGDMRKAIAEALGIAADVVSVKATTTDGMGFTGRGEGIAAMAVVTIRG